MSGFKAKNASNSISAGAPPQTPLGELTFIDMYRGMVYTRARGSGAPPQTP